MVLSMYQSILHFIEKDIIEIEKITGLMLKGEKDANELSLEVVNRTMTMANRLINIERRNEPKELLDIAGTLRFNRTGYVDKGTGEYIYLLDQILGLEGHQRITLGATSKILEETLLTSYQKGGKAASPRDVASKQAVKRLVHETVIDIPTPASESKTILYQGLLLNYKIRILDRLYDKGWCYLCAL